MRLNRTRNALLASAFITAVALAATPASADNNSYDGLWNVTVVTKSGSCEPTTSSTLIVSDGKVSAGGAPAGSVGREGLVRVSINGAYANGHLSGRTGSGKWNGASAGVPCSGRWEASRQ